MATDEYPANCAVCSSQIQSQKYEEQWDWDSFWKLFDERERKEICSPFESNISVHEVLCWPCEEVFTELIQVSKQIEDLKRRALELRGKVQNTFRTTHRQYYLDASKQQHCATKPAARIQHLIAKSFSGEESSVIKYQPQSPDFQQNDVEFEFGPCLSPAESLIDEQNRVDASALTEPDKKPAVGNSTECKNAIVSIARLSQATYLRYMKKLEDFQLEFSQRPPTLRKSTCKVGGRRSRLARSRTIKCPHRPCKHKSTFSSEEHLQTHIKIVHEGVTHPFTCNECGRKFRQPKLFELHLKTHEGEYPFKCQHCNAGFIHKSALRIHEVKHTPDQPYKCTICSKAYKGHNGLNYHTKIAHMKVKPFVCDTCGKTFVSSDKLKRHIGSVHATGKPMMCHLCGKSFSIRNYLYMHMRIHEGNPCISKARKKQSQKSSEDNNNISSSDNPETACYSEQPQEGTLQPQGVVLISDSVSMFEEGSTTITIPIEVTPANVLLFPPLEFPATTSQGVDDVAQQKSVLVQYEEH